jgi:16S rRNA (uracil1498-N3)-methyltransferase
MEISSALSLSEILPRVEPGSGLVADPGGGPVAALLPAAGWVLAVGPEGGFSPAEDGQLADSGWRRTRLGPHVLRTETAAIVGAAILMTRTRETDVHSGDA